MKVVNGKGEGSETWLMTHNLELIDRRNHYKKNRELRFDWMTKKMIRQGVLRPKLNKPEVMKSTPFFLKMQHGLTIIKQSPHTSLPNMKQAWM